MEHAYLTGSSEFVSSVGDWLRDRGMNVTTDPTVNATWEEDRMEFVQARYRYGETITVTLMPEDFDIQPEMPRDAEGRPDWSLAADYILSIHEHPGDWDPEYPIDDE